MIQNIINFIWGLIIIIAPVFILVGGLMILTAGVKPDQVTAGKKVITYAIVGLVIAFAAWAALNMLFNALVGTGPEGIPWPWYQINC